MAAREDIYSPFRAQPTLRQSFRVLSSVKLIAESSRLKTSRCVSPSLSNIPPPRDWCAPAVAESSTEGDLGRP
jgi:hypothetical protein